LSDPNNRLNFTAIAINFAINFAAIINKVNGFIIIDINFIIPAVIATIDLDDLYFDTDFITIQHFINFLNDDSLNYNFKSEQLTHFPNGAAINFKGIA